MHITMQLRYGPDRSVYPKATGPDVVVASLQRSCKLFLNILFDGRSQVLCILCQLHRSIYHDRRTLRGLGDINVVNFSTDKCVRERRH